MTATNTEHTPELWEITGQSHRDYEGAEIGTGDKTVAVILTADPVEATAEEQANGRRIVAAVNACKGIDTGALETGIIGQTRVALARAEFLIRRVADGDHHALENLRNAADQALAAICKLPAA
jgi:hypothetical protein